MGFLRRSLKNEEPDPRPASEEAYERMFPKIARDFVYKEDFYRLVERLLPLIDPLGQNIQYMRSDIEARRKALEYKAVLDSGRDGSKIYKDIIDLDE